MFGPEVILILLAWAIAGGSPGPATLAISGTAMNNGRASGVAIALGVVCGSACWGLAAALGMSAIMAAHSWMFEIVRYAGAAYLLFLAFKSLRSGLRPTALVAKPVSTERLFVKGFLIHITNPKAILAWGSVYAVALPASATAVQVWVLSAMLIATSIVVFVGYGMLFALPTVAQSYAKLKRWFDLTFAALFGAASLKVFTARLEV